ARQRGKSRRGEPARERHRPLRCDRSGVSGGRGPGADPRAQGDPGEGRVPPGDLARGRRGAAQLGTVAATPPRTYAGAASDRCRVPGPVARTGSPSGLVVADVLEVDRLAVDAAGRRCDPVGEVPWREDGPMHDGAQVGLVRLARQPLVPLPFELLLGDEAALRVEVVARIRPL